MGWNAKATGAYLRTSSQAIENAREIYSILSGLGWTLNAVCGLLGNVGYESGYNPWRWQGDSIGTSSSGLGYGLVQWTPAGNYINDNVAKTYSGYNPNYSGHTGNASDGRAQVLFINLNQVDDGEGGKGAQYYVNPDYSYNVTWPQYKVSALGAGYLAKAWLHNFERPEDQSTSVENERAEEAEYWYNLLSGGTTPSGYSVTVTTIGNGTASASPSSGVSSGTTVTLTATPNEGATFTGWTVLSGDVTISNNTFTMPSSNVIIQANFEGGVATDTYTVTVISLYSGVAWATPNSNLSGGETITLHAVPDNGWKLDHWQVLSGGVTIKNNSFTMPKENVIILAYFKKKSSKWIYYMRPSYIRD